MDSKALNRRSNFTRLQLTTMPLLPWSIQQEEYGQREQQEGGDNLYTGQTRTARTSLFGHDEDPTILMLEIIDEALELVSDDGIMDPCHGSFASISSGMDEEDEGSKHQERQ